METGIRDEQYIALELTKILCGDGKYTHIQVFEYYVYFLSHLTNTVDDINTIVSLKDKVAKLEKENRLLRENNRDILNPFKAKIVKLVDETKGDMEPYVYTALTSVCQEDVQ